MLNRFISSTAIEVQFGKTNWQKTVRKHRDPCSNHINHEWNVNNLWFRDNMIKKNTNEEKFGFQADELHGIVEKKVKFGKDSKKEKLYD